MKTLLPFLVVLLFTLHAVSAQETPEASDWTTVQRCITAPSQPPSGWTYDGVIFTFKSGDGIHARRADVATPYYVAFDSDSEFGASGSFSPDGKWFAVPEGRKAKAPTTMLDVYDYFTNEIRVYSTVPSHEMYHFSLWRWDSGSSSRIIPPVLWLDNRRFIAQGLHDGSTMLSHHLVDPIGGVLENYALPLPDAYYVSVSPDSSRLVYMMGGSNRVEGYRLMTSAGAVISDPLDLGGTVYISMLPIGFWTSDSSRFAAITQSGHQIRIYDRDSRLLDELDSATYIFSYSFALNGVRIAYAISGGTIHIADFADAYYHRYLHRKRRTRLPCHRMVVNWRSG